MNAVCEIKLSSGSWLPRFGSFVLNTMSGRLKSLSSLRCWIGLSRRAMSGGIWRTTQQRFFSTAVPASFVAPKENLKQAKPSKWNIQKTCPELIKYWHPTKNTDYDPSELSVKSTKKIWWRCAKGPDHEWEAAPRVLYAMQAKGKTICPFCSNQKVSVTNSLATLYPEIASQWHPTLNKDVTPSKVLPTSSLSVWWKCDKGEDHVWKRVIDHRTHPRSPIEDKCPFCSGVDTKSISLATCRPDLAAEWDYERNEGLTPENVSKSSAKMVWWTCPKGHHYQCTVYNRGSTHNTNCPICSGRQVVDATKLTSNRALMDLVDFSKNRDVDWERVSVLSKKQLFWRCPESLFDPQKKNHLWKCSIHDMVSLYDCECPFCSNKMIMESRSRPPPRSRSV